MKKQSGFGLLLLLTLLVAISGYALAAMSTGLQSSISLAHAVRMNAALEQSRQALISYSAHYPYLYGPRGAGAGHLPCPDTDSLDSDTTSWSVKHGPNPPCGNSTVAVGRLPSHISFAEGRYMIHAGLGPRVDYIVSSRVINNPGNHPVNPALMLSLNATMQHSGLLRQWVPSSNLHRIKSSEILLTKNAHMLGIRPSVAAWLIEKLNNHTKSICALNQNSSIQDPLYESDSPCLRIRQLYLQCGSEENSSTVGQATLDTFQYKRLLLQLADAIPEQFQCAQNALDQLHIDDVPAKQHWLIRNGWLDWIRVEHDAQCLQPPYNLCKLKYLNGRSLDTLHEPLMFRWVLS